MRIGSPFALALFLALGPVAACGPVADAPPGIVAIDSVSSDAGQRVDVPTDTGAPRDVGADAAPLDVVRPDVATCVDDEDCRPLVDGAAGCLLPLCLRGMCTTSRAADGAPCREGDPCFADGRCEAGECQGTPTSCDDANPCTDDRCDGALGCVHGVRDGAPCDDGDPRTSADRCDGATCSGTLVCDCAVDTDCPDDGDLCTGVPVCVEGCRCEPDPLTDVRCDTSADTECAHTRCVPSTGACQLVASPDGGPCDDRNRCTDGDRCASGQCRGAQVLCDDGNPCTSDLCDAEVGCVHFGTGGSCDDGSACTTGDTCTDGRCVGAPRDCDDRNPCTSDGCEPAVGCLAAPLSDGACDDDFLCTVGERCIDGACVADHNQCPCDADDDCALFGPGDGCLGAPRCLSGRCERVPDAPVECPPEDPGACVRWECVPSVGACRTFAVVDGTACDDGDACTSGDRCRGGTCVGAAVDCDDGNACTEDSCASSGGCTHAPREGPCEDGDLCTLADECEGGLCQSGGGVDCSDGNPCTDDTCVPSSGCRHVPNTAPCEDGSLCTTGDECHGGTCRSGSVVDCDDDEPCTIDVCDPERGCTRTLALGVPCDDGDRCSLGDRCTLRGCEPKGIQLCDDGLSCTRDACDPATGCLHEQLEGPCDDGNACTAGETCVRGRCEGGVPVCECQTDADCAVWDDGDLCNGVLVCDQGAAPYVCVTAPNSVVVCEAAGDTACRTSRCVPATGQCEFETSTEGAPCDDADACTGGDACEAGVCRGTEPVTCDDGRVCTDDACDPTLGCVHADNAAECSDGDPCTEGDVCEDGTCRSGTAEACDDGDPCTTDACDPVGGCVHGPEVGPCDDGDACTVGESCLGGACQGGQAVVCDDRNPCTEDLCRSAVGCTSAPAPGECDDADPCTRDDTCVDGRCTSSAVLDCDDGDGCTVDVCLADGTCRHDVAPVGTPCDDADASTVADQCVGAGHCRGFVRTDLVRTGTTETAFTDIAWTRFTVGLTEVDALYVSAVEEREGGVRWTWIAPVFESTLGAPQALTPGATIQALSHRLAVGDGVVLRHDGGGWTPAVELLTQLTLATGTSPELRVVHGAVTGTRESYELGGLDADDAVGLWRCRDGEGDGFAAGTWQCTSGAVPAGLTSVRGVVGVAAAAGTEADSAWAIASSEGPSTTSVLAWSAVTGWSSDAPAGCAPGPGTPCGGTLWLDLAPGSGTEVWAVGGGGGILRYDGRTWRRLVLPPESLLPGTELAEYSWSAARAGDGRLHVAGTWTGCLHGPCATEVPDARRFVVAQYDATADAFGPVRTIFDPCSPDGCPDGVTPADFAVAAMELRGRTHPGLYVVGSGPANGGARAGLLFYLDMR